MRAMGTLVRVVLYVVENRDQMFKVLRQPYMCMGCDGKATTRDGGLETLGEAYGWEEGALWSLHTVHHLLTLDLYSRIIVDSP